jgi:senataxin
MLFFLLSCCIYSSGTNVLGKLQPQSTWYLTALGSFATTQREYVALHAFRRLNAQVMYTKLSSIWLLFYYFAVGFD